MTCPNCGRDAVLVTEIRQVEGAQGQTLEFPDEFWRCESCGEEYYSAGQSLATSRARAAALRASQGLLTPDQIRAIRERHALTQTELESLLRLGRKTVVRWERGSVCQSLAVDGLLRVLDTSGPIGLKSLMDPPDVTEWVVVADPAQWHPPVTGEVSVALRSSPLTGAWATGRALANALVEESTYDVDHFAGWCFLGTGPPETGAEDESNEVRAADPAAARAA